MRNYLAAVAGVGLHSVSRFAHVQGLSQLAYLQTDVHALTRGNIGREFCRSGGEARHAN